MHSTGSRTRPRCPLGQDADFAGATLYLPLGYDRVVGRAPYGERVDAFTTRLASGSAGVAAPAGSAVDRDLISAIVADPGDWGDGYDWPVCSRSVAQRRVAEWAR